MKNDKKSVRANPCAKTCSLTQGASPTFRCPPRPPMPGGCAHLPSPHLKSKRHVATAFAAARESSPPPHPPRLFKPFLQKERLLSSLGLGQLGDKVCNSGDHLPPTSMAKTTRRAQLPLPALGTYVPCASWRWSTTPASLNCSMRFNASQPLALIPALFHAQRSSTSAAATL